MSIAGAAKSLLPPYSRCSTAALLSLLMSVVYMLPVGHAANAQENERLEVDLIVTAHGRELFDSWENPDGKHFEVVPVKIAPRGKFLSAVVLFRGCRADASGNCNVELDIVAYDPAGKVYGEMKRAELWQHRPAPTPGHTQLGVAYMGLEIEPQDPAGVYRIEAVARDLNADVARVSATQFEVE